MNQNLRPHGSSQAINTIKLLLDNQNIQLPEEILQRVIDSHSYFLFETEEGRKTVLQKCKMDWEPGESDMVYKIADTYPEVLIPGDQIYFYKVAVSKGQFFRPNLLDGYYLEKKDCRNCGIEAHCTRSTRDGYGGGTTLCIHCMNCSSNESVRAEARALDGCEGCTIYDCKNHPNSIAFLREIR